MKTLLRRIIFSAKPKKNRFGADEAVGVNWFAVLLLVTAVIFLCFLLYALLGDLIFGTDPDYKIVPYGSNVSATPPPSFTLAPTVTLPVPTAAPSSTPAPVLPISASTAGQLAILVQIGGLSAEVSSVAFSPDGRLIAAGALDGSVRAWDVTTLQQVHSFQSSSNRVNSIAFSPDGARLVAGGQDTTVRVWDLRSGTETGLIGPNAAVRGVAYSPDGMRLAAASDDRVIYVWDTTGAEPVLAGLLSGHSSYVTSLAFSPDGRTIAAGGEDDTVRLWDVASGAVRGVLSGHTSTVTSVSFSSDGSTLVSTGADKTVRVWNLLSESVVAVLQGHTENVNDAAFSPDGTLIASAGAGITDNTVRLWDARSGAALRAPLAVPGPANALAFSPDGRLLATGGATYVILWQVGSPAAAGAAGTPVPGAVGVPASGGACLLTVRVASAALRSGPDESFAAAITVAAGEQLQAVGWTTGVDGYTWWRLANGTWARGDVFVDAANPAPPAACANLAPFADAIPTPIPSATPAFTPLPAVAGSCVLTVYTAGARRTSPVESAALNGTLIVGQQVQATGWSTAADGYTWWQLADGTWARGDAFLNPANPSLPGACLALPAVSGGAAAPTASAACTLTVRLAQANLRAGPGTGFAVTRQVTIGTPLQAIGWAQDAEGYTWWRLSDGAWVRGDTVVDAANPDVPGACLSLPQAQ